MLNPETADSLVWVGEGETAGCFRMGKASWVEIEVMFLLLAHHPMRNAWAQAGINFLPLFQHKWRQIQTVSAG
jgi:hypothetical protein